MEIQFFPSKTWIVDKFWYFVVTYRVTNFLPKLIDMLLFSKEKNWISIFSGFPLFSDFALSVATLQQDWNKKRSSIVKACWSVLGRCCLKIGLEHIRQENVEKKFGNLQRKCVFFQVRPWGKKTRRSTLLQRNPKMCEKIYTNLTFDWGKVRRTILESVCFSPRSGNLSATVVALSFSWAPDQHGHLTFGIRRKNAVVFQITWEIISCLANKCTSATSLLNKHSCLQIVKNGDTV